MEPEPPPHAASTARDGAAPSTKVYACLVQSGGAFGAVFGRLPPGRVPARLLALWVRPRGAARLGAGLYRASASAAIRAKSSTASVSPRASSEIPAAFARASSSSRDQP